MFKTITISVAVFVTIIFALANSAIAKTPMFPGSTWNFSNDEVIHVETLNYLTNTTVSVMDDGSRYTLVFNGKFTLGLTDRLEEVIVEIKAANVARGDNYATAIYLNSRGGKALEGMVMGHMFRKNQVQTLVAGDMECWSACADAFIGGKYRTISHDGVVGVHAPYVNGKFGTSTCISQHSEEAQPFTDYADNMLGAQANIYNNKAFKCDVYGGVEIKSNQSWIQN